MITSLSIFDPIVMDNRLILDHKALEANRNIIARDYWKARLCDFDFNAYDNFNSGAMAGKPYHRSDEASHPSPRQRELPALHREPATVRRLGTLAPQRAAERSGRDRRRGALVRPPPAGI